MNYNCNACGRRDCDGDIRRNVRGGFYRSEVCPRPVSVPKFRNPIADNITDAERQAVYALRQRLAPA